MTKLSIITINYNNAEGLRRTIESVVSQTFTNFEYIVIDGGSTDGSVGVIKQYADKITYWVSEPDKGIYNAMNKGIKVAQGEYCLFLNSGDELYDCNIIKEVVSQGLCESDLIYGDLKRTFDDYTTDVVKMPDSLTAKFLIEKTLCHPVTFIKKELFIKHGYYREDLNIVADWAFFLKIIISNNTTYKHINNIISNFYMDGISSKVENLDLLNSERNKITNEYFSSDILKMHLTYSSYASFYNKPIFRYIRKVKKWIKIFYSMRINREFVYKHRIVSLIRLFNKIVYNQLNDINTIPIIIINYNRLTDLQRLISFLKERGHKEIIIIDNNSDYQPLIEYYDKIKNEITIERLNKNWGHLVVWQNREIYEKYCSGYYVVTDSDIIPNENLQINYLSIMIKFLNKNHDVTKVGFALKIDDIPDTFKLKAQVLSWEAKYWTNEIKKNVFRASTDTTFALYFPEYDYSENNFLNSIRLGGDFCSRHGGWYINHENLSMEDEYYFHTANDSNSWKMNLNGELIITEKSESYL